MRTPKELLTVRAFGRAAAAVLLLPAILGRGGARQGRRGSTAREFESISRFADELSRSTDVEGVARTLLDEISTLFAVGFVGLTFVSDDGREASGYLARSLGEDVDWWHELRIDLGSEPSGIASAVFEATALTVYDTASSGVVSSRLVEAVGAKSAAFVPLLVQERVTAVISVATLDEPRIFSNEDLAVMQTLASEAAVALEQLRTSVALEEALTRERLLASIARRLRSELDLPAALAGAAEATARALDASRCLVRIGETPDQAHVGAEWHRAGLSPLGEGTLPELELLERAAAEQRPVVETVEGGTAVAVPVLVFERPAGFVSVHRSSTRVWGKGDLALLHGVAAEIGLALRLARLLEENEERLAQQGALLRAAHVLSSDLDLAIVLQRLADQLAQLLDADAADCYLLDGERGLFRCVAVHGFDRRLLGFEFPSGQGLAGAAVREGRPLIESDYGKIAEPIPHPAYDGFTDVITAPMVWSDEVRGVLGVGRRAGRRFAEREADVLGAFAGLASLALRNAEMFTQSSQQARVQRGFYRIASVLGQSLSRSATLEAIAQAAAEALGGSSAAVLVPSSGRLEAVGAYELPVDLGRIFDERAAERQGPLFRAAAEGRILVSSVISDDERLLPDLRKAAGANGYRALISVPVDAPRDAGRGLVLIFFAEERSFSDDDIELARHLADATRGALERSGLFEAERGARALAQQLTRTGRLLTSELDPAAVLDEVVQQAPALVNADAAAFRLLDEEELVVTAADGAGAEAALGSRSPAGGWLSGDVVQSGAPVSLSRAGEDERLRGLDPLLQAGHAAFLGVPVGGPEGAILGVLAVYASAPREWREEEIEALLAVAASTSAALSNAELYQRVALERERSVAILANIADGIVAVDRDGDVVLWNSAAERITGVPAPAALGRPPIDVLQRSLESPDEGARGDRFVSIMRGREEVWLSVTEAVMRDPVGAVSGRIFAFRDISGDRLVEQVKSDFVSTVSHELRTPLTSIYGFAETLLRQDVMFGEEERQTFLRYIASESQRLTSIVDTLLNVARLDTGDLQVNLAETDVREVVGQVLETVPATEIDEHRFVVELPEEPLAAKADAEKLRQVCSILVDNALRYSPEGGTVTVGASRRGDRVEISVADEGIGIPQSDQEQIFRKFYRGADAEQRAGSGGTGLGLFIARGLVTAMGGRIWVSSREGEGSRFAFELPAAVADPVTTGQERV
ncbi:MAG TPA: GAF domain-containing protein [Gaiellaceae bacterium]|nr:GAF domain-containing protein [Gaiellaceae bacterium]